jgi:predicted lipoprotein with Yx(FWY)xxD motif
MERMPDRERMPGHIEDVTWRMRRGVVAVVAVAALAVGACSAPTGAATTAPTTAPTTVPASAPAASAPAESAAAGYTTLTLATDATLGAHVTGRDGMSLYVFTPDTATTSACVDQCATSWPPVIVEDEGDAQAGAGVTGALGTITRTDGAKQLTLGGHPLYYFANDKAAGDLNGQGLNDKWYAAGADGTGVGMSGAPAPSTGSGKGSY